MVPAGWSFERHPSGGIIVYGLPGDCVVRADGLGLRSIPEEVLHALASALLDGADSSDVTEQQIAAVRDGMAGGPHGWLTNFGYVQFARRVLELRNERATWEIAGVRATLADIRSEWRSCTKCLDEHEGRSCDAFSPVFRCQVGDGFGARGRLGAVWQHGVPDRRQAASRC